jgi:hypothetical protein
MNRAPRRLAAPDPSRPCSSRWIAFPIALRLIPGSGRNSSSYGRDSSRPLRPGALDGWPLPIRPVQWIASLSPLGSSLSVGWEPATVGGQTARWRPGTRTGRDESRPYGLRVPSTAGRSPFVRARSFAAPSIPMDCVSHRAPAHPRQRARFIFVRARFIAPLSIPIHRAPVHPDPSRSGSSPAAGAIHLRTGAIHRAPVHPDPSRSGSSPAAGAIHRAPVSALRRLLGGHILAPVAQPHQPLDVGSGAVSGRYRYGNHDYAGTIKSFSSA